MSRSNQPCFHDEALRFLRGLARNNRREWFEPRRAIYEQELKAPMLALIERVTAEMAVYAPQHVRPAQKSLLRLARDTRFSADKTPYKTHLAAWWTREGFPKTSGAGYYLQLGARELELAAGLFMPTKEQALAVRRSLLTRHAEFQRLLEAPRVRRHFDVNDPDAMARAPRGFPAVHPAQPWLRWRKWGWTATLPASLALDPTLHAEITKRFRLAAPLVDWLNDAILSSGSPEPEKPRRAPFFALY